MSKTNGEFVNLSVTNLSVVDAQFHATTVSADAVVVAGSNVSLEGHGHSIADVADLESILSGVTSSTLQKDMVTADTGSFRLLSVSGSASFHVNQVNANVVKVDGTDVALVGHSHSAADIPDLQTALSGFASTGHTHSELAGITSSTIARDSGTFDAVTASVGTFETLNVTSSATIDVTNLVADSITVADLNLLGTLSVSTTTFQSITTVDLSVTGNMTLNGSAIATQAYVNAQIEAAIGQVLASAY